ncbi:MAG: lipid carrier--UDP-N-acetylgalactosaminyltransferase [Flavobacteriaceae bacterium]|nr:lipid carrier--UDP-N-acetylgalactosaminyltransferase [Flavobacteriaceae bacterium]
MKRIFDVVLSSLSIIFLSPFLILISIILLLTGEHLVFYSQARIGRGGKPFNLIKFVTMTKESPNIGSGDITLKNDPRVLRVGKLLRKTKINELPQIINVLKGDMSIVGPRPLTRKIYDYYSDDIKSKIIELRPGLTGMGSIIFRDEESLFDKSGMDYSIFYKNNITPYKGSLEIWYYKNKSLFLDLKIVFLTAMIIVNPKIRLRKYFHSLPESNNTLKELLR